MLFDFGIDSLQNMETENKSRFLRLLSSVSMAANGSVNLEEAAQVCIDEVCSTFGWEVGHLFIIKSEFHFQSSIWCFSEPHHFDEFKMASENIPFRIGIGLPGMIVKGKRAFWIEDVVVFSNFPRAKYADKVGLITGFGIPVLVENKVVAVLEFFSTRKIPRDDYTLELVSVLGSQLGRVAERKIFYESILRREQQLRLIFNTVSEVIFLIEITPEDRFRFLQVNKAFELFTGLTENQVFGKYIEEVIPEFSMDLMISKYQDLIRKQKIVKWEEPLETPIGKLIGEVIVAPMVNDDGSCSRLVVSIHDITERKHYELEIERLNEKYKQQARRGR